MELKKVEHKIFEMCQKKVMLAPKVIEVDLAELYEVETKALNPAVKRNIDRFPFKDVHDAISYLIERDMQKDKQTNRKKIKFN